jgi:Mce-associated membrane protein
MTNPTPNPTWYDVLGVSRDATPEEIKTAWRLTTDKFEPGSGSGQFRMFSEAADVLLDPARRAAYDASLGTPLSEPVAEPAPEPVAEPSDEVPAAAEPAEEPPPAPAPEDAAESAPAPRRAASRGLFVATALLAILAVAAVVIAGWYALKVRQDGQVADARIQAPAAAEQAAKVIFAYDYRHLDADKDRAHDFLTSSFAKEYLKSFDALEKQKDGSPGLAVQSKTVVTSTVMGSGVVDAETDVARVLVYVDQTSKKAGQDPQIFQNRVAMTMEKQGDHWLVDDVKSY